MHFEKLPQTTQFVFYSFSFTFGMVLLWYRPWLWDIKECWRNIPFHPVDLGSFVYYVIQSGYYLSCTITLPFDNKVWANAMHDSPVCIRISVRWLKLEEILLDPRSVTWAFFFFGMADMESISLTLVPSFAPVSLCRGRTSSSSQCTTLRRWLCSSSRTRSTFGGWARSSWSCMMSQTLCWRGPSPSTTRV